MAGIAQDDIVAGLAEAEKVRYEHNLKHPSISDSHSVKETNDGIHDGLEFPTDEEKQTLRRVPDKIPTNAYRRSLLL